MIRHNVSIQLDPAHVGQAFANTGDDSQSIMLNKMGEELRALCGQKYDTQICAISALLDNHGKRLIKDLHEFIKIREQD